MSNIFNNQTKLKSFLIVVILILLAWIVIDCGNDRKRDQDLEGWKSVATAKAQEVEIWKNNEGKSRARAKVAEADIEILKSAYAEEFRRMSKEFEIKEKNIVHAAFISTKTKGTISVALKDSSTAKIPSVKIDRELNSYTPFMDSVAKTFSYRDRWLSISGYFLRDSLNLNYTFYDSITLATSYKERKFTKPKTWFANRELQIDAISDNPHSAITKMATLSVKPPVRSRFGLGPFVGYTPRGAVIGVGVHWDLIQF